MNLPCVMADNNFAINLSMWLEVIRFHQWVKVKNTGVVSYTIYEQKISSCWSSFLLRVDDEFYLRTLCLLLQMANSYEGYALTDECSCWYSQTVVLRIPSLPFSTNSTFSTSSFVSLYESCRSVWQICCFLLSFYFSAFSSTFSTSLSCLIDETARMDKRVCTNCSFSALSTPLQKWMCLL